MALMTAGLIAVMSLAACSSLKMSSGWDKNADFSKYHTWAWKDDGSIQDPVWNRRVQSVLEDELGKHGLTRSDEKPDLWVACHWRLSIDTQVVSYNPGWGYTWGYWAGPEMTQVYQVPSGALFIDYANRIRDRKAEIRRGKENEEREERLRAILAKMFAGYPPPKA